MAIDPRNYDVAELRAAGSGEPLPLREERDGEDGAGESESGGTAAATSAGESESESAAPETPSRPAAAVAFETSIARDLAALDQGTENLERPYLPALPPSLVAEALIFEWLEFLVLQAGRESVADALEFYERVGWLGSGAADSLDAYLSGVSDPRANEANDLDPDDHRVSLHYIARLASLSRR